jgi:heme A synthase
LGGRVTPGETAIDAIQDGPVEIDRGWTAPDMKNAQRLAFATAIVTVVLIGVGVLVRATGSGLGCPDWPTCHGSVVPPGQKHALIEMSHRFTASLVGFMVIGTAIMAWRHYRESRFIVRTSILVVPLVGFQGILGAITVKRELPPEIVATHLLTAMLVLTCELAVAWAMFLEDPDSPARFRTVSRPIRRWLGGWAAVGTLWLAAVLLVGGYMSESGASTACSGWPACNGSVFPAADDQEITHMLHRYLAGALLFVLLPFIVTCWRCRADIPWSAPAAVAVSVLYVAQVAVGALNVWFTFPDPLTVTHTVIASGIWFTLSCAIVLAFYVPAAERRVGQLSGREVPA